MIELQTREVLPVDGCPQVWIKPPRLDREMAVYFLFLIQRAMILTINRSIVRTTLKISNAVISITSFLPEGELEGGRLPNRGSTSELYNITTT